MQQIIKEYYKYCILGVFITGFDFSLLIAQVELLNINYLLAACISYVFAAVLHYILSVKYVFVDANIDDEWKAFVIFFIIGVISLGLFESLMYYFVEILKIHYIIAKVFATAIIFTFNFASRKFILFKN